ncbi:hypothetical protein [Acetivibrio clariflavus]|nr:hypothetical protein [Acetivibrio clariflavus]
MDIGQNRSAIEAVAVIGKWAEKPWVLEFDIKGLFDNIGPRIIK